MDGRTWLCLVLLLAPAGCARNAGTALGPARQAVVEDTIAERPTLREIFRDGRYEFLAADARLRRWAHRRLERNEAAQEGIQKLSLRVVRAERGGGPMVVFAIVMSDVPVEDPSTWEGFMRGLSDVAGEAVEEGDIDGVKTAYVSVPRAKTLGVYYAPDLLIRIESLPETPRRELEDLARYLLEAR